LTIALPTYNNHELLFNQVSRILPQLTNNVDFIIIDNHSIPPVQQFLETKELDLSAIRFIRNDTNIGADANIFKCFEISNSEWLWILSDNDLILNNVLTKVLNIIKISNDFFFINLGNPKETLTEGFQNFCKKINYSNSFTISNCLYKLSTLSYLYPFYKKYLNSHQAQILIVLKYLDTHSDGKCLLSNESVISWSLPSTWSKYVFIKDSIVVYSAFTSKNSIIFRKTAGKQFFAMQVTLISISHVFQGLRIIDSIRILKFVMKYTKYYQWLSVKLIKPFFLLTISFISPFLYRFYCKNLLKTHYTKTSNQTSSKLFIED